MDKEKKLNTVLIINKFGPDAKDITGKSAYDVGNFLTQHGCQVKYLSLKSTGKNNRSSSQESLSYNHNIKISNVKLGKSAPGLLLSSLIEGLMLICKACFVSKKVVIIMTAPSMLNFWGIFFQNWSRSKVFFWTMDLYPDAFVSNGLVTESNRLLKGISRFIYRHPADAFITLGRQQLNYLEKKYRQPLKAVVLPCGIQQIFRENEPPAWITIEDKQKLKFCYAGNIGQAHDEEFLIAFAKSLQQEKHVLYINLYGTKAQRVLNAIELLPAIKKIDYLSYGQMHFIDVHLVSLQSGWNHVCVPSKAVSAICAGAVLLLNTSKMCDAWNMFKAACWLIEQKRGDYERDIPIFLMEVTKEQIAVKQQNAFKLAEALQQQQTNAYYTLAGWINEDK